MICYINKVEIRNIAVPVVLVTLGNLLSFLLSYILIGITPVMFEESADFYSRIDYIAEKLPVYIVGAMFLVLTLVIEMPIVYFGTRRYTKRKGRLLLTIIAANVLTTSATAIIEHIVYRGRW